MKKGKPRYFKQNNSSWFTEYAHRWPSEALAMGYAMACVEVVSQNREQAGLLYSNMLKAWAKPGTSDLYNKVISQIANTEIEEWKEIVKHPESVIESDVNEPWIKAAEMLGNTEATKEVVEGEWGVKTDKVEEEFPETWDLLMLIIEFILKGFNRKQDTEKGKYKVIPSTSPPWLLLAVMCRTGFESKNITSSTMRRLFKVRNIKGKDYDFEEILTMQPWSRKHRWVASAAKEAKMTLRHDNKFLDAAWLWYQCRIVHLGIEKFLDSEADKLNYPDLKNVQKEVQLCDKAIGYQRFGQTLD